MPANSIKIPLPVALRMIGGYAATRLREQVKAVAFIVAYLVAFQVLVFGRAPAHALWVALGILLVVLGLALFLEGLLLGLMPLAKRVGVRLSHRIGLKAILPIGFLVGLGSTLAEPAVAALRAVGRDIAAWEAPLLFFLLHRNPGWLILSIGVGVGVAVAIGMMRFYLDFSIKLAILPVLGVLLPISFVVSRSSQLGAILGLAWDAGAITTGAVTVPLVLALGIGMSRQLGTVKGRVRGLGIVALASLLPVLTVIALGVAVLPQVPPPMGESEFFAPENREQVLGLFATEDDFRDYALRWGSEESRRLVEEEQDAEPDEHGAFLPEPLDGLRDRDSLPAILGHEATQAARAVLPLTVALGVLLLGLMRDRPRYLDEVFLGIAFALFGMTLLTTGIRIGLSELGNEVGRQLPQVYSDSQVEKEQIVIHDFDPEVVFRAVSSTEGEIKVFHLLHGQSVLTVEYQPEWHDPERRVYVHRVRASPLTHPGLSRIGLLLILLFAFGMGYGSTVAEPALNALGRTVEDLTVGNVKGGSVVRAVSLGVGAGLVVGVVRLLYDLPTVWMILPPYLLLIPLTLASDEDFAGIAWDSGGVTTGAVTVPLVLAMGLGLGSQIQVADGFAILAMASVYPIIAVLLFGLLVRVRQRKVARAVEGAASHA